jgi:hypothetical protein
MKAVIRTNGNHNLFQLNICTSAHLYPYRYLYFISAGLAEKIDVLGILLLQALNHTTLVKKE